MRIDAEDHLILGLQHKSIPPRFWGRSADEVAAERHPVSAFATPLVTLDRSASDSNVANLFGWARAAGLEMAPHGKTSMAPTLWRRMIDAGAWGITVATPWQAQVARAAGVSRVFIANEVSDPIGAAWLAGETDDGFEISCWVDSTAGVALLAATEGTRPIDVLVELGAIGGRAGARGTAAALDVARAVAAEPRLRLRGASGYEGTYGADRSPAAEGRVRAFLTDLRDFSTQLAELGLVLDQPIVTAGGSTWFDLVADILGPLTTTTTVVLRSGSFQAHDDIYYDEVSPFAGTDLSLRAALTVWARVVSRPEPTLALLDAGNRDVPFDKGLPVPLDLVDARVTGLNDQHAFLEIAPGSTLAVGDIVRLGISHPCTMFDRWRLMPEVDDATAADPRVVGFIQTWF